MEFINSYTIKKLISENSILSSQKLVYKQLRPLHVLSKCPGPNLFTRCGPRSEEVSDELAIYLFYQNTLTVTLITIYE